MARFCLCFLVVSLVINTDPAPGQENELPLITVGIVADVQYSDADNRGSRYYRSSPAKLREAMSVFRTENVDFIINLGDLIDNDFDSFKPLSCIINESRIPFYSVMGNHDFSVKDCYKAKIDSVLNHSNRYYSMLRSDWRFIFLDGTDISLYANGKNSSDYKLARSILDSLEGSGSPNAFDWNGGIGRDQTGWLVQHLNEAENSDENVVVLCHFPVFPDNQAENLWNAGEIKKILEEYKGRLILMNGHTHQSGSVQNNGVWYVSLRGMVEKEENSFAIAEFYGDSVFIRGYGAEKSTSVCW